jgi:hypothetical protein
LIANNAVAANGGDKFSVIQVLNSYFHTSSTGMGVIASPIHRDAITRLK